MELLIGSLIVLALIVIMLLCVVGIYFIILIMAVIKEALEDLIITLKEE